MATRQPSARPAVASTGPPGADRSSGVSPDKLLRRVGRTEEARDAYRRALALVHDDAERHLLERRMAKLGA